MKRTILTPPDFTGGALADVKQWLAITGPAQDGTLARLVGAAAQACEAFTGTLPLEATCEDVLPASREWQVLAARPVNAILAVEGVPAEGPRFALSAEAHAIALDPDGSGRVRVMQPGAAGRVAVRYAAGYASDWAALPETLRHGIVRLAAELFRARDGEAPPGRILPAAVAALWHPWRRTRLA